MITFKALTLLFFLFSTTIAVESISSQQKKNVVVSIPSFLYNRFDRESNFESNIALYGHAKAVNNGSSLQLTGSLRSSAGRIMYKKPIKLVEGKPWSLVSFSTYFEFSLSNGIGDGLSFFMVPSGSKDKVFGNTNSTNSSFGLSLSEEKSNKTDMLVVEFDTLRDDRYGDLNGNHMGVDIGSFVSVKAKNLSSVNIVLSSGQKLHSWIDYQASSRRLEVRLSKSGSFRPEEPLISYPVDFSKLWKNEQVFVGLSSSNGNGNGNSSQTCRVSSWIFKLRHVPHWMHSEPMDLKVYGNEGASVKEHKRSDCFLKILAALIFGTGCGALGAFILLYLWTIFGRRRPVVPEEFVASPEDFEYKKVNVAVGKTIEDGK